MKIKNINFKSEKQKYINDVKSLKFKLIKDENQNKLNNGPQIKKIFSVHQCTNDGKLINPLRVFDNNFSSLISIISILIIISICLIITIPIALINHEQVWMIILTLLNIFIVAFILFRNLKWFSKIIIERKEILLKNNIIKPQRYFKKSN